MLELPESVTIAKQLNQAILGKQTVKVLAGNSPHRFTFFFGDVQNYPTLLSGLAFERAASYGGMVELTAGDMRLVLGDGANLRYLEPGARRPAKHQLLLEFEDGSALVCSVQMYGGIWAFRDGENDNFYYLVAKEKPSPLSADFDEAYFERLFSETKDCSAKAFLATEQRIPGLGNGVLQDILFDAGIHPKTKISQLSDPQTELLYQCVKHGLAAMAEGGGRDTEKDLFGSPGGYHSKLSKNTWHNPCPVCAGTIQRKAYLGGNVYYCPQCQPIQD